MPQTNYYEVLGILPTATENEIKNRYRKLMHQYSVNASPEGAKVGEAYQILSNPEQREAHNQQLSGLAPLMIQIPFASGEGNDRALVVQSAIPLLDSIKEAKLSRLEVLKVALSDERIALAILDDKELAGKLGVLKTNLGEKYLCCALKIIQENRLFKPLTNSLFPNLFNMACSHVESCSAFFDNKDLKHLVTGKLLFEFKDKNNILAITRKKHPEIEKRFQAYKMIIEGYSVNDLADKLGESNLTLEEFYLLGLKNLDIAKASLKHSNFLTYIKEQKPSWFLALCIAHPSLLSLSNIDISALPFEKIGITRIIDFAKISKEICLAVIKSKAIREEFNGEIWNDLLSFFRSDSEILQVIRDDPDAFKKFTAYQYLMNVTKPDIYEYIANLKVTLKTANIFQSSDTYELIIQKKLSIEQLLIIIEDAELVAILSYKIGSLACIDQKIADKVLSQPELCNLFAYQESILFELAKTTEKNCLSIFKNPLFKPYFTGDVLRQLVEKYPQSSRIAEAICDDPSLENRFQQATLLQNVTQKTNQLAENTGNIPADDGAGEFSIAMMYLTNKKPLFALKYLMIATEKRHQGAAGELGVFLTGYPNSYAKEKLALANFYSWTSLEQVEHNSEANTWYYRAAQAGSHEALLKLMPLILYRMRQENYNTDKDEEFRLLLNVMIKDGKKLPEIALNIAYQFKDNNFSRYSILFFEFATDLDAEHTLAMAEEFLKYRYEKNQVGKEHKTGDIVRIQEIRIRQHCIDKTLPCFINALNKAVLEDNNKLKLIIAGRIHEMLAELIQYHYLPSYTTYQKICDCKPLLPKEAETNISLLEKIEFLYQEYSSFLIIIHQEQEKSIKSPYLLNIFSQPKLYCLELIKTYKQLESLYKEESNLTLLHLALCIFNKDLTLDEIKAMPNYLRKIVVNLLSDACTESLDFFNSIMKHRYLRLDFDLDSVQMEFSQRAKAKERLTVLQAEIAAEIQAAHQKRKGHWQDKDWEFESDNENDIDEEPYENELYEKVKNLIKSDEKDDISSHIISTLFYVQNETGDPDSSFQISIKKTLCHAMNHQDSFLLKILLKNVRIQQFLRTANLTQTELSQLLCAVIQIGELELVKTVVELGASVNPIDVNFYPLRSSLDKAPIIQYLIEKGAKIREDLIQNEAEYERVTIDCRKTLLYYLADRNKPLTDVFKYSFAPILREKSFSTQFDTENFLTMLYSFLMTGLLDKKILPSIEKGFEMEKDQKTIFEVVKELVKLLEAIYISQTAIEKFLEIQKSNPYKDIFISYIIHRLFLNPSKSKLVFSHLLIQKITDPVFKDILSNKLFFSALIEEKISPEIFQIIRDVIYNRSRDSQDLKLSETYTLVKKAISSISKKNPALNGYLWQHFRNKYTRYLFTAEKFEQLLSLWHEGIKDNLLSVDTMLNYIDHYQSNISITLLVCALLNYRVSLMNQKQEIFESESHLINEVLTTNKSTLKEIVAVQKNIGIEFELEIDINNVNKIQNLRALLLEYEWKTNKTSNELAINIYLNGNRPHARSYLVNANDNWLDVFIKENNYQLWQGYLEKTQPEELWEDFQSCGKTPTDRKNHFQTFIRQSPNLPADKCYNQIFQNTFPFEIINLFTDNNEEYKLSRKEAREDLIHLLHLLGSLKETSKHDINQKLRTYLTKVSQYDKKENTKKSNTFFASEPSDYYGSLRKCFLTLKPTEELPRLARSFIETAKLQYASPGARQFITQYNSTYPTKAKSGLSKSQVEKIEEEVFSL